mgnify:FL=1
MFLVPWNITRATCDLSQNAYGDHCNVATWQHGQKMSWVLGNMAWCPRQHGNMAWCPTWFLLHGQAAKKKTLTRLDPRWLLHKIWSQNYFSFLGIYMKPKGIFTNGPVRSGAQALQTV